MRRLFASLLFLVPLWGSAGETPTPATDPVDRIMEAVPNTAPSTAPAPQQATVAPLGDGSVETQGNGPASETVVGKDYPPFALVEESVEELEAIRAYLPARLVRAMEKHRMTRITSRTTRNADGSGEIVSVFVPTGLIRSHGRAPLHWFDKNLEGSLDGAVVGLKGHGERLFVALFLKENGMAENTNLRKLNPATDWGWWFTIAIYRAPGAFAGLMGRREPVEVVQDRLPSVEEFAAQEELAEEVKEATEGERRFESLPITPDNIRVEIVGDKALVLLRIDPRDLPKGSGAWHYYAPKRGQALLAIHQALGYEARPEHLAYLDLHARYNPKTVVAVVKSGGDWRLTQPGDGWLIPIKVREVDQLVHVVNAYQQRLERTATG